MPPEAFPRHNVDIGAVAVHLDAYRSYLGGILITVPSDEVERRVRAMTAALRGRGLRLTHQRLEIARQVAATDEHPDVERVFREVRERVPTVSLDTVYRTLAALADVGLLTRVTAAAGPARYDANPSLHHHFVCTRCGMIRDVREPSLDALRVPDSASRLGRVEAVEVYLRGVCEDCTRKGVSE